ncbi:COMM domain-containing protein 3 [Thrips palmi]|uniref:COMM domain-containing protein 3 n=1 Tax=Thrips palmi TaxID=161013 RepID=A0A6P8ZZ67_THRPL|nr:COMM domain-containing protein 3 [Thrips palmi]
METRLCADVLSGLKRLGNSTLVNEDLFSKLLVCGVNTITQSNSQSLNFLSLATGSSKGDVMKEAHFSLLALLVEAARMDVSSDSLQSFLESKVNWPANRCKKLTTAFNEALPHIQVSLANVGFHPPHVVDVKWSLLHNIKSSSSEHAANTIVAVNFKTEGMTNSSEDDVQFMCTLPELQDLVSKLKEALRQMERVAQMSHP